LRRIEALERAIDAGGGWSIGLASPGGPRQSAGR
jgi:hypothetical protein